MTTRIYTTLVGDDEPIEELPAEIFVYGYRVNRPGRINFSLSLDHEKAVVTNVEPGVHEVAVERNKAVVWRGPVLQVVEDDRMRTLVFNGEGLLHYTSRMHVTDDLAFTSIDLAVICRALIDHHQDKAGGDFGIDTSGSESSRVATRMYEGYEIRNIAESLYQLAETDDGIDFEVDPDTRRFIVHYPQAGTRQESIVYDQRNIRSFHRTKNSANQASQILGVGTGDGVSKLTASTQDSAAVAAYRLTQRVRSRVEETTQSVLDDYVLAQLALFKDVPNTLAITVGTSDPDPFTAALGDEIRINWPSPYDPVDEFQRLVGLDIIWNSGEEEAVLYTTPL